MKKMITLLLVAVLGIVLSVSLASAGVISTARETGSSFLSKVHGQVGFGTHDFRATPHENSHGFYFARLEAPILFDDLLYITLEPRRDAGREADRDVKWSGSFSLRLF